MTVESALNQFFSLLPNWTDERHKALIVIAFSSGAYAAAAMAVNGDPEAVKTEARAICERLKAAFDSIDAVH